MAGTFLETPIEYLKGVGPERGKLLRNELNITCFGDLLSYFPFRYVDRTKFHKTNELDADMPYVQLRGRIISMEVVGKNRAQRMVANFKDDSGIIELVWFQGIKWLKNTLKSGTEYVVFGKPTVFNGKFNIAHPEVDEVNEENLKLQSSLQAMYNSSDKLKTRSLDSRGISKLVRAVLQNGAGKIPENLPADVISKQRFISRETAFYQIHLPANAEMLKNAEMRLKFDELFYISLTLLRQKSVNQKIYHGFRFGSIGEYFNTFYKANLPFELTNAQKKVLKEIRTDVGSGKHMNRLLQGDVGSGKTIVALMTMLMALDNGFQACLMAPTEILAAQHFEGISGLLKGMNINVGLLTGSTKISVRRKIHEQLLSGEMHILLGTHALIEPKVQFKNLGMVVVDEQHRFGVEQRAKLWKKNTNSPHVLIMTATPIPRTLAMTLYGDLDVSVIDELPPGRKPIKTVHLFDSNRLRIFGFMQEQIKLGRQIYVVYPLIEESETMDYKDLMDGYESMVRAFPRPQYEVGVIHGRMSAADKDLVMEQFLKNRINILVATTVIEVGVNVPNASVMVIESAERFGLSQLHQLRGRVGRGADQSYCMLVTSFKLSADAKLRLETMCKTNDGFEIADVDLRLRGPGDLAGTQQSGLPDFKISNLATDGAILTEARNAALKVLEEDPQFSQPKNQVIALYLNFINRNKQNWARIS
ncbi:MAG: ATP-dependent DNA helicase RecG [Bacteroidia bacterium]